MSVNIEEGNIHMYIMKKNGTLQVM